MSNSDPFDPANFAEPTVAPQPEPAKPKPAPSPDDPAPSLEISLLGACLIDPTHVPLLNDGIRELTGRNRDVARAMLDIHAEGRDPDIVTVYKRSGVEHAYLAHLIQGVPKSSNAPHYLAELQRIRGRRRAANGLIAAAKAILEGDADSVVDDLIDAAQDDRTAGKPVSHLEAIDLHAVLSDPPIEPPWIYPKWLARGDKTLFAAVSGYGKSYVLLDLALALATGQPFLDMSPAEDTEPLRVTIIDEENAILQDQRRLGELMRGRELDLRDVENIPLRCIVGQNVRFQAQAAYDALRRELDAHPCDVLMLDSLVRFIAGRDESSAQEMSEFFSAYLDPIQRDYGCGIFGLHHIRKTPGGKFKGQDDPHSMVRGSGDITAWPDAVWVGTRDGRARSLQVTKSRWASEGAALALELEENTPRTGASRIVATEEREEANQFVLIKLTAAGEQGMIVKELTEAFHAERECSIESARKAVGRSLAYLRGSGQVRSEQDGRGVRNWLVQPS